MPIKSRLTFRLLIIMFAFLIGCESKEPPPFRCEDTIGCIDIPQEGPVKIAALQVISGEVKTLGIDQIRAAELAISNHKGRLMGHPIELKQFDEMCSKEGGRTAAQRIVSDPTIVAVFGTTCSGAAAPAMEIISEAGFTMISGANTAPSLTSVGGKKGPDHYVGFYRTSHNDEIQGWAAAAFAYQVLMKRKAATIHDGDTYTKGLAQVFQQEFQKLGGEIVVATAVNKGDMDMRPVLTAVVDSGAGIVFFPLFQPEGDYITKQARKMQAFDSITLMGADSLLQKTFVSSVGNDGIGMYFVGPAKPEGPEYNAMFSLYMKKYNEPPIGPLHAHAYDALNVLINTIESIAIQGKDGGLHIGRQALRNSLQKTSGYKGLTGVINCNEFGDCSAPRIKVVRLDDPEAGFEGLTANIQHTYMPMKGN